jgi:cytochrome c oxidase subunit 4
MAAHASAHAHAHPHGPSHGHVSPIGLYLTIFVALMVLTVVTVAVAFVDLGAMNKFVALGIASFKATLVVLYFMHVKYASRLTKLVVVSGFFFLAILLSLTMTDYGSRMWVNPPDLLQ